MGFVQSAFQLFSSTVDVEGGKPAVNGHLPPVTKRRRVSSKGSSGPVREKGLSTGKKQLVTDTTSHLPTSAHASFGVEALLKSPKKATEQATAGANLNGTPSSQSFIDEVVDRVIAGATDENAVGTGGAESMNLLPRATKSPNCHGLVSFLLLFPVITTEPL